MAQFQNEHDCKFLCELSRGIHKSIAFIHTSSDEPVLLNNILYVCKPELNL